MNEALAIALNALQSRIVRVFPAQIRAAVEPLTDEELWWRPNETSNSVANILIHITGSLNHYLNFRIGGVEYARDRAAEFAERKHIPKEELLAAFDEMVQKAEATFAALTPERLAEPSPEPDLYRIVLEDLLTIATHIANHAGQISWIAKMLHEGAVDEVWIRTHKRLGAWKTKERR